MKPRVEITKQCRLCEIGTLGADQETVICLKNGIMPLDGICSKFRYDPLKREPKLPPKQLFEPEEFEF